MEVQEWPEPAVGEGEVRIAVRAAVGSTSPTPWRGWAFTPPRRRGHASWAMRSPAKSRPSAPVSAVLSSGSG